MRHVMADLFQNATKRGEEEVKKIDEATSNAQ